MVDCGACIDGVLRCGINNVGCICVGDNGATVVIATIDSIYMCL